MSYKSKAESIADHLPQAAPAVRRHPCAANGCPMAGAIFTGGTVGSCAYHYGTHSTDWPRITQVLKDWECLTLEINAARRTHTNPDLAGSSESLQEEFGKAVTRLHALAPTWWDQIKPKAGEDYRGWAYRLEMFLGAKVVEVIRKRVGQQRIAA